MPSLRARFVVPEPGVVIEDGVVEWSGGEIARVGDGGRTTFTAKHAVVIPGLVNAHAHLELSALRGTSPSGTRFTDWIIAFNRACADWKRPKWRHSVALGARRLTQTGTTSIGDILNRHWLYGTIRNQRRRIRTYLELLQTREGPDRAQWDEVRTLAQYYPDVGLSPHAPYSVTPWLYQRAAAWARDAGRPIATHASETKEEIELLKSGDGALKKLFDAFGSPLPFAWPPEMRPIPYLDGLGALGPTTNLIHANYLTDEDIRIIRRSKSTVTFCPGSHAYFHHADHPLPRLMRAGIPVALGTDSWASNTDLDMRLEMKRTVEDHGVPPWKALEMATIAGARALFPGEKVGRLAPGWAADMTILDAHGVKGAAIADWIAAFRPTVHGVVVAGKFVLRSKRHVR